MYHRDSKNSNSKNIPLISIIITVLNGGKTIEQCLNSIYHQTFSNYELVIVDGGSTDNTVQVINVSPVTNKTVEVLPGVGLYAGLNAGINLSIGKWLYFIGADDKLHDNDTLQWVAEIIKRKKADTKVFVGNVLCVKQKDILRPKFGSPYLLRHFVHHQGMFYDRNIFNDFLYNESMRIASDYEFNMKLALMKMPHQFIDIIVCDFGGDGISENQLKHGYKEMQQAHHRLFSGASFYWIKNYFWIRRKMGSILRYYNLLWLRKLLRGILG